MGRYAENTKVTIDRTRAEIERTLERYGADQFLYGWDGATGGAMLGFRMEERQVRFVVRLPLQIEKEFTHTPTGQRRHPDTAHAAWEKACRQRWRALALVIKAKLEAVESGITDFEDEFLAHIVLPNGSTAAEFMRPQIAEAYATGRMPTMLPALGAGDPVSGDDHG